MPESGSYDLIGDGAAGGSSFPGLFSFYGGGADVSGDIFLTAGTLLDFVAGGGGSSPNLDGSPPYFGGGGGGGSFVWEVTVPEPSTWADARRLRRPRLPGACAQAEVASA